MEGKSPMETQKVISMCGICPGYCGAQVEVVDGRLERVEPLPEHPINFLCPRGLASRQVVYSPDRLKYPLKREGERGEGRWARIGWEEALDTIAMRLQEVASQYGPAAVAEYSGRGAFEQSLWDAFQGEKFAVSKNFLFPFGSPNRFDCGSICFMSFGQLAPIPTFGVPIFQLNPDISNSDLIVVWGANPATDSPPLILRRILEARERGAQVVVIDPMYSDTTSIADTWFPVRPGTDGALALSLLHVIFQEGLYDPELAEKWTVGFEELKEYVQGFSPQKGEEITRVPAERIVKLARAIAGAKGASLVTYTGMEYTNSGVQNIRAQFILWFLSGNIDVPGGNVFSMAPPVRLNRISFKAPTEPRAIGADKYPLFYEYTSAGQFMELPKAVLEGDPYPIKALIIDGGSILTSYPDPPRWEKALRALDFLVVIDRFMTNEADLADIILPATTYYEITSYKLYPNYLQLRQRVIDPVGESRNDYLIYRELADRLGCEEYPPTEESLVDHILKHSGYTVEELKKHPEGIRLQPTPMVYQKYEKGLMRRDKQPGFETPSGKVEIASSILARYGYDALPVYQEPQEGPLAAPELARRYPLVLSTGARIQSTFRSQHQNIPWLLDMQREPLAILHPRDAQERGIADGDKVIVETARGEAPFTARVTEGILPGVVEVNVGGGGRNHLPGWKEANANLLTDPDNRDPISGFPVLKALLCDVRRKA